MSYFDMDNVEQDLDIDDFIFVSRESDFYIEPKMGKSWPTAYPRDDAFTVVFVAGYDEIPTNIQRAVRLIVAHWYEHRKEVVLGQTATNIPMGADALMGISRTGWVG
jgi:hypothetical protein